MAYDRYDTRNRPRDDRPRWSDDRYGNRDRGSPEDRGFFERAGDEIASWFGDDEAKRRRRRDNLWYERERGHGSREPGDYRGGEYWQDRTWTHDRGDRDLGRDDDRDRGYRPVTGDYGRSREHADSEQFFAASGTPRSGFDPNYHSWRSRHLNELDRDYDDYRRENQAKFEDAFTSWRERRQQKRRLLGMIREHMEVIGSDDEHVGTIDRIAGDRVILTKSDPESGGVHHSLSCSEIDRVEGDKVILDCPAEQARQRWRDESRNRALFEREDQGEIGPRMLDRSFQGTYR